MKEFNPFFLTKQQAIFLEQQYKTPLFIYDEIRLEENAKKLLSFPNAFGLTVRYAIKANSNQNLIKIFDTLGICFDASSVYEAKRLLYIGIKAEKISLTTQELTSGFEVIIKKGVFFHASSLHQLETFGKKFKNQSLGLRFNPGIGSGRHHKTNVGGVGSSFGIWHQEIKQVKNLIKKYDLKVGCVHTHIGSGGDPKVWKKATKITFKILEDFPQATCLNLGGGFRVKQMPFEKETNLTELGLEVKKRTFVFFKKTKRKIHLEIEPGAMLVANTANLLSKVQDKVCTGKRGYVFLKLNVGMDNFLRTSLYGALHPLKGFTLSQDKSHQKKSYLVVGHCCESGDLFTSKRGEPNELMPRKMEKLEIGDLFLIGVVGAYCNSMAAKNYNSFPEPAECLKRKDGKFKIIKVRQSIEQMIENEKKIL